MAKNGLQKLTTVIFLLTIACCQLYGQNRTVTGKITSGTGDPLPGASVSVTGSTSGTSAGPDGAFTLAVPANATIRVSAVGYTEQEKKVGGQSTINFVLQPASTQLEQVVVVGYGTQRKEAVTGSVASIGGERLREVPSPNIT